MPKSSINVSIPTRLVEKFDDEVVASSSNRSAEIENLMRKAVELQSSEDREKERRLQEIDQKMDERKQTQDEISDEISDLEQERELIKQQIEEEEKHEDKFDEAVDSLENHLMRKRSASTCSSMDEALSRLTSSEPFWNWVEQLDCGSDELKSALRENYVKSDSAEVSSA